MTSSQPGSSSNYPYSVTITPDTNTFPTASFHSYPTASTYDTSGLHFYLNDALGTRRAQTDAAGVIEQTCQSLPFGDQLDCGLSLSAPTEHHFTGKERDTESGLDFFGARYYGSNMGRFMFPDWSAKEEPVPYAKLDNPQTLNLYAYVGNNPMARVDSDGHWSQPFHYSLIQDEFGFLGAHAVQVLRNASDWVDSIENGNQATNLSYMHSMSDGEHHQTVAEAQRLATNYVTSELTTVVHYQLAFEKSGGKGNNDSALNHFGRALHTTTDATSPEHRGYQPWFCLWCTSAYNHHKAENASVPRTNPTM